MGGGSSSKGGDMTPHARVVPDPPVRTYEEAKAKLAEDRAKQSKMLLAMKGRQSTILTGAELGVPRVSQQRLLGI